MKKVTGLGGVFFKCIDPKSMNEWYSKNLGLQTSDWELRLTGGTPMIRQKKEAQPGPHFRRIPNISIPRKNLL